MEIDIVWVYVVGGICGAVLAIVLAIKDSKRKTKAEWEQEKNIEEIKAAADRISELSNQIVNNIENKVLETDGVEGLEKLRTSQDPENRLSATERKFYEAKLKEK